MALKLRRGLAPSEIAFLCEMEMVTVAARQRLEGLQLLGVSAHLYVYTGLQRRRSQCHVGSPPPFQGRTPALLPPYRSSLPLWLALLLKRQGRANIIPPGWLNVSSLTSILNTERESQRFSPPPLFPTYISISHPFLPTAIADAARDSLPYHWLEVGEMLLDAAPDDMLEPDSLKRLMRDLREVRMAKLREGFKVLEGGREVKMNGVGGMEVSEGRSFIGGLVDGLRWVTASKC